MAVVDTVLLGSLRWCFHSVVFPSVCSGLGCAQLLVAPWKQRSSQGLVPVCSQGTTHHPGLQLCDLPPGLPTLGGLSVGLIFVILPFLPECFPHTCQADKMLQRERERVRIAFIRCITADPVENGPLCFYKPSHNGGLCSCERRK